MIGALARTSLHLRYDTRTALPDRSTASFDAAPGETVFCESGSLWITQGDGKDYILNAGESLTLAPKDSVVIAVMAGPAIAWRQHPAAARAAA